MKRILATFLISLMSTSSSFAETVSIHNVYGQYPWKLGRGNQVDIQNTKQPIKINISVKNFIYGNGTRILADRVTLDCDGFVSKINPGYSQTCQLKNVGHHAKIYISQDDFLNGSEGTFDISDETTH
jgi:hypothetical protein